MQAKLASLLREEAPEPHKTSDTQQMQQQPRQQQVSFKAARTGYLRSSNSNNLIMLHSQSSDADAQDAKQIFLQATEQPLAGFQPEPRRVLLLQTGETVARMPGLGVYYSESSDGVPAIMEHVLGNMPALYSCMVFLTVRAVPVPTVTEDERFLAWRCAACFDSELGLLQLKRRLLSCFDSAQPYSIAEVPHCRGALQSQGQCNVRGATQSQGY
jgi:hypothetical protein